jgi:hypothetical protein
VSSLRVPLNLSRLLEESNRIFSRRGAAISSRVSNSASATAKFGEIRPCTGVIVPVLRARPPGALCRVHQLNPVGAGEIGPARTKASRIALESRAAPQGSLRTLRALVPRPTGAFRGVGDANPQHAPVWPSGPFLFLTYNSPERSSGPLY